MLKTLLIGLYVISTINSVCTDGCLKCVDSTCRICDSTSGYTISGSVCQKITLENCTTMDQRGKCLKCPDNYYLDANTSKCIAVASADVIENCSTYTGSNSCGVCKPKFYLDKGACTASPTTIDKCEVYSSLGTCTVCESGYYLNFGGMSCVTNPKSKNCASYTNIECTSCSSGYVKNLNNYLYQFLNLSSPTFETDVTNWILNNKNNNIDRKSLRVCQAVQLSNCDSYQSFNKCNTCVSGHFLNSSSTCSKYPVATIVNCDIYSDLTNCSVCKPGYYLESSNNCVLSPVVENCEVYTNIDNSSECAKCFDGYYLLTFNACVLRKNPQIDNCITLKPNAEACETCNVGYRATDDGAKCLNIINNCASYDPANVLSNELRCYKCDEGYYYNVQSNTCVMGTVANCQIYEKTNNICSKCNNKFYLEGETCKAHDVLLNCEIYHPRLKNICTTCDSKTFLFEKDNQCVPVTPISKCELYNGITSCEKCEDGYYFNNGSCLQIPVAENCLRRNGLKCGKCIKDFILEDGVCRDSLDYIVNECASDNVDGSTNFAKSECKYCKENAFPLSYEDAYVCVETHYMTTLRKGVALTTNCTHYAPLADGTFECTKCVDGKYLDNGSCVSSCTSVGRQTLYRQIIKVNNQEGDKHNESFFVEKVNVCWTTIPGCAVAAPNITQSKVELLNYQCIQCNTDRIARVNFDSNMTLITDPTDASFPFGNSPVSRAPGLECYDPTVASAKMVGDVNSTSKKVASCEYYRSWGSITGCTKCAHGYTGVVVDVVTQCNIYLNDAYNCKACNSGYYLASAYECKQVVEIEFCTAYSTTSNTTTCTQCNSNRYLNGNVCTARVNSLNVVNSTLITTADDVTCNTGYFKVAGTPIRCVLMTTNCINGTMVNSTFECNECDHSKSYFNTVTKACITGSKSNCKTYHNTQNTCIECNNNYYLNNGSCIANNSSDTNCTTWSQTTKNTCSTCNDDSILFTVNNKCRNVTATIQQCEKYDSLLTCETCEYGYRLENLKTRCLAIPAADNCLISTVIDFKNNGKVDVEDGDIGGVGTGIFYYTCDKCDTGFARVLKRTFRDKDNLVDLEQYACYNELAYKRGNCSTNTFDGLNNFENSDCTACTTGFYPRNWVNNNICLENSYFSIKSSVSITNCKKMIWSAANSKYECAECNYPYSLQSDNTCGSTCAAGNNIVFSYFEINANNIQHKGNDSACVPDANLSAVVSNCLIYSAMYDFSASACVKCKTNYSPVITYASKPVLIDGYASTTGKPVSPISVHPAVDACIDPASNATIRVLGDVDTTTKRIRNCKYYQKFEDDDGTGKVVYGCVRCDYGYTGKVIDFTKQDTTVTGYIQSCAQPTTPKNCATTFDDNAIGLGLNSDYIGAHLGLTKYFSCLKCANSDYIPFAFVESGTNIYDIGNLREYTIPITGTNYNDSVAGGDEMNAVECVKMYNGNTGVLNVATNELDLAAGTETNFPFHCALGVLAVDSDGDNTNNVTTAITTPFKISAYCVACKTGYAPVYAIIDTNTIFQVIVNCIAITNCTPAGTDTWFNSCQSCVHHYDIYTDTVDYTRCVDNSDAGSNCFAAYEVGTCVICEKGYDKNNLGACVQETVPHCTVTNNNRNFSYYYDDNVKNIGLTSAYFFGEAENKGCSVCDSDYILTKITENAGTLHDTNLSKYVCTTFTSEPESVDKPNESNCATYGMLSTNVKCKSCNANYTLTDDNKCKNGAVDNCKVIKATDGYTCITCDDTYTNVGGKCFLTTGLQTKTNCDTFHDSSTSTFAKCNVCKDGFVKRADESHCDAIDNTLYPNCLALNAGACSKCSSMHSLTTLANGVKYCYPLYVPGTPGTMQYDANCEAVDETKFNNKQIECTQCASGFVIESGNTDYPTHCAPFFRGVVDNCKQYDKTGALNAITLKCLNCDSETTHYFKTATSQCIARTAVANCAIFDTNLDKCSTCSDNYALSENGLTCSALPGAIVSPNRAPNGGYIQKCLAMSTCSSKVKYPGLSPHLSSIFSCHKCATSGLIPLAVVRAGESFGAIEGLQEFGLNPTAGQRYDTKAGESAVTCVNPVRATFNIDAGKFNFPTNCGAAVLNANSVADATSSASATNVDRTKVAVMCVACAPGYAPTGATDALGVAVPYMVSSCTLIANCESSLWFSACSQCKSNHSYGYVEGTGVLYDKCISYSTNPSCFAVDNSDSNNLKCKFCRKGYYLNKDNYCELLHPPRCGYAEFRFKRSYASQDLGTGLFLSNDGIGCQKCDDGFVGLFNAAGSKQICTQSPYHTNGLVASTSKFVFACKNYGVGSGDNHKCVTCKDGYTLTVEGTCVISTQITNCNIAYSADSCYKCKDPYVSVNRKCVTGTIVNCTHYGNNENSNKQICIQCAEGYYLKDNVCTAGTIRNCSVYASKNICNACNTGFGLVKSKDGYDYCYPIDSSLNCSELDYTSLQNGKLQCKTCNSNQFVISTDQNLYNRNLCMPFIEIENCLQYDRTPNIQDSSFKCATCENGFYLKDGVCNVRTVVLSQCSKYSPDADTCSECNPKYFLAANGTACTAFPNGIAGCRTYKSETECSNCQANMYLDKNQCLTVSESDRIANCTYYDDSQTCSQCSTGYLVSEGKCEATNAQNCSTYENINACETCPSGYGLKLVDGLLNCVQKNVTNCSVSEDIEPYACLVCDREYYVSEGVCAAVPTPITNCIQYDGPSTCAKCDAGSVLAVDNLSCIKTTEVVSVLDTNCKEAKMTGDLICNSCQPGYVFVNGVCSACSAKTLEKGCYVCDPENPDVCLMCSSGFYQYDEQRCVKNGLLPDDDDDDTPEPESLMVIKAVAVAIMLLMFV